MRLLALHLMTGGATLVILVLLAMPAKRAFERGGDAQAAPRASVPTADFTPSPHPRRVTGVYVDPWHVDDWARAIGAAPQAVAKFEAFSSRRPLSGYADQASRMGIRRLMVSWEPWHPVPSELGVAAQSRPQPGFRNLDIARGTQDRYITRIARELARLPRHRLSPLRPRDERLLVPVEQRTRGRIAGRGGGSFKLFAVARRRQRPLRLVRQREPLRVPVGLAHDAAELLARAAVRRPGRDDHDRLRRRQGLPGPAFAPRLRALRADYRQARWCWPRPTPRRGARDGLAARAAGSCCAGQPWIRGVFS